MELHLRTGDGVTYRPSPIRVGGFAVFGLLGPIRLYALKAGWVSRVA